MVINSRFPIILEVPKAQPEEGATETDLFLGEYICDARPQWDTIRIDEPLVFRPERDSQSFWRPDGRVGFRAEDRSLCSVAPGEEPHAWLAGPFHSVTLSPDGQELAYVKDDQLWLSRADGSHEHRVKVPARVRPCRPHFTPEGLLFTGWGLDGTEESGIYHRRGSGEVERLTSGSDDEGVASPDGQTIAFVRSGWEGEQLRVKNLASGEERALHAVREGLHGLAFSPDGSRILFSQPGSCPCEDLCVVASDGQSPANKLGVHAYRAVPRLSS